MTTELAAYVRLLNRMHFQGSVQSGYTIDLDTPACDGGGAGMTPMELVLISLASCSAMDVAAILRKKRQPVEQLEVRVRGQRQTEHPTVFSSINLEYVVHGSDVDPQAVTRAIELSRRSLRENRLHTPTLRTLAAAYSLLGRMDDARATMAELRELEPSLTAGALQARYPGRDSPQAARFIAALLEAGLPP